MDGIIIINKPKGCTSYNIVSKTKKIFGTKVGHAGTLDPNATGVLPILIGKGTLLSKYLINHDKIYEVVLKLGIKTSSADSDGDIVDKKSVPDEIFDITYIQKILNCFKGKISQTPPMYSAIKVNGKKLYEYARKGQNVNLEPRTIQIYNIELSGFDKIDKEISFVVSCSKGTYIRSLCEDIATKFNTVGYMKELKRIKVGDFSICDSITLQELEANKDNNLFLDKHIIKIEDIFKNNDLVELNSDKLKLFLNGVKLSFELEDGVYKIYYDSKFIGTGVIANNLLKRDIIV